MHCGHGPTLHRGRGMARLRAAVPVELAEDARSSRGLREVSRLIVINSNKELTVCIGVTMIIVFVVRVVRSQC